MNILLHRYRLAILLIWIASMTHANCGVIDTLDKLHSVETRLSHNPNSPLFTSDIRFLTSQARQLSGSSVTEGLGASPISDKGTAFLYFIYYAKKLALEVSVDDPSTAMRHFQNPVVRENITDVGTFLTEMRCSESEIANAESFPIVPSDQIDIDLLVARAYLGSVFTMRNVLIVIAIVAALLSRALLKQSKNQKAS